MTEPIDILLVDDRAEGLVTIEAVLNSPEYRLIKASSGQEALAKILNYDFALILLDVQMPEMDGFETARYIKQRERSRDIPIIFMTAINKAEAYVSLGYEVGAVDYLFKPFDPGILKSKVAVFAELYRKSRKINQQGETLRELQQRESARILNELEIETRRRYQNLADAIPHILWRASQVGKFDYFNRFFNSYSGLTIEQSSKDGWALSSHPEDLELLYKKWEEAARNQAGFEIECRLWHPQSQDYRWHLLKVIPESDGTSTTTGWIGTATDIQDQKLIQQELLQAKEAADAASEAKTRFLANVSHEIRTPLGAMLGFTELLISQDLAQEKKSEYGNIIRRNGEQLSKLIDEVLDLSKIEAGKLRFDLVETSVVDLFHDVKSMVAFVAAEKGLNLQFEVSGEIPQYIVTDPLRLRQILINIIGNGIKFSNGGSVNVRIEENQEQRQLAIHVTDSGPGLTAAQIAKLFQPFSQGDASMSRKYGGSGLGLALSRKFAQALGGDITVKESLPGEGSHFTISVSIGQPKNIQKTQSLTKSNPPMEASAEVEQLLRGVRVLLVEDTIDNQILIGHFLRIAGAEVDIACNGEDGVKKALAGEHQVVLMDIQMPVMDGYAATRALRQQGYRKPIVALTAHAMIEERQRCMAAGCTDHLTKPIRRAQLIDSVLGLAKEIPHPEETNLHLAGS